MAACSALSAMGLAVDHNPCNDACGDDLESLGYVLLYFIKGQLPWQGIPARTKKEKYEKIRDKKLSTQIE